MNVLIARWHATAETLHVWGAEAEARVLERCAEELAVAVATRDDELLTLRQAGEESGYSVSHLRRLISQGVLSDVSETGPPRVRRADLPRKPGYHPTAPSVLGLG